MTKDSSIPSLHHQGGGKKFLYSSPPKRHGAAAAASQFDDDVDDTEWSFTGQINTTTNKLQHSQKRASPDFDVDNVWNFHKNVNVPNPTTSTTTKASASNPAPTLNAGKGYYSRHTMGGPDGAGMPGNSQSAAGLSDGSWQPANSSSNHSYSYGGQYNPATSGTDNGDLTNSMSPRQPPGGGYNNASPRQPQGGGYNRGPGVSQGGRVSNGVGHRQYTRPN